MRLMSLFGVAIITLIGAGACHGQDYQKIADSTPWSWSKERASVGDSFLT